MKETPLSERHRKLGAKMTAFAGYQMPLVYSSVREEHMAVRNAVGIFDVSHMGEFIVKGMQATALLQYVTSNDVAKLEIGDAQYSCLPNESGGIVDDLLVYRLDEDQCSAGEQAYMLVVNASNIEKDLSWINQHNSFDTRVIDISDQTGLLALQGPNARKTLQDLTDLPLKEMAYYTFRKGRVADEDNILVSATGYTGSGGFEIYGPNESIVRIWDALMLLEKAPVPAGLGARDTLRLEKGYCLYGNDINDQTSPLEAGLGWITKFSKEDFIAKDLLQKQKEQGVVRKLVGFQLHTRRVPRPGYSIVNEAGREIGVVTSGTFSPSLEIPIGMGYVEKEFSSKMNKIYIMAGNKRLESQIVKVPFC